MTGVDELDAVPEGIVDVTPGALGLVGVRPYVDPGRRRRRDQPGQITYHQRRMGLPGRAEIGLDAQMEGDGARREPAPPRAAIGSGLGIRTNPRNPA